jgi:hypothetical protein
MAMPVGKPQWLLQPFGSFITSPIFTDHLYIIRIKRAVCALVVLKMDNGITFLIKAQYNPEPQVRVTLPADQITDIHL